MRADVSMPPSMPVLEAVRLSQNARNVLAYLRSHSEATNVELCQPEVGGLRGVGRVWDLQQAGHDIQKRPVRRGVWAYRLIETPTLPGL